MIKYLTVAIVLFAMSISTAQTSRTDTTTQLSVYNTGILLLRYRKRLEMRFLFKTINL